MLLAVEGGGFFTSSASGYSKGLTLLLLGQKKEEKPMQVTPWNQYQLVDQESNPDLLLASGKNRLVRGCTSFVCFSRAAAGLESPSPLKVGPTQQQDILPQPPVSDKGKELKVDTHTTDIVDNDIIIAKKVDLKSSLKKTKTNIPVSSVVGNESAVLSEKVINVPSDSERRKVQWTDVSGGELVEVREFEARPLCYYSRNILYVMSGRSSIQQALSQPYSYKDGDDGGSDNEFDNRNGRTCSCRIM